jgi:hypothetical protein
MQEPFDRQSLGGATGHYARAHLDTISGSLHGRRRNHLNGYWSHPTERLQQHHRIGRAAAPALLNNQIVREYE